MRTELLVFLAQQVHLQLQGAELQLQPTQDEHGMADAALWQFSMSMSAEGGRRELQTLQTSRNTSLCPKKH